MLQGELAFFLSGIRQEFPVLPSDLTHTKVWATSVTLSLAKFSVANFWAELKLAGTMVALPAAAGCEASAFSSPLASLSSQYGTSVNSSVLTESREIDAGIIFAGQASYLCLPLTEPTPQAYSIVRCRSPPMRF